MIGRLPTSLTVNGVDYEIRADFRNCLVIIQAFSDAELSDEEKTEVMLRCLYKDFDNIPYQDYKEASEQAIWFLNCGNTVNTPKQKEPIYDFEKDEQMIFSSINKVAGREIRNDVFLHFWTFFGLFNEIGEGMFSSVLNIRSKKRKHKKLEKWEQEFYNENKEIIDLPKRYTKEEQEEMDLVKELFG